MSAKKLDMKKIYASNVFSIQVERKMQKGLIIEQKEGVLQIIKFQNPTRKMFSILLKFVNNHHLRRRAVDV